MCTTAFRHVRVRGGDTHICLLAFDEILYALEQTDVEGVLVVGTNGAELLGKLVGHSSLLQHVHQKVIHHLWEREGV